MKSTLERVKQYVKLLKGNTSAVTVYDFRQLKACSSYINDFLFDKGENETGEGIK